MFYDFLWRRRVGLVFLALSFVTLLLVLLQKSHPTATDRVSNAMSFLLAPLQRGVSAGMRTFGRGWDWLTSLSKLRDENAQLRADVAQLRSENERLKEVELENLRLQKLLNFKEKVYLRVALAHVIGREPTSWYRSMVMDKGSRQNVSRNMAVVTHAGIVGRVIETSGRTSKVMLITDPRSSVSALVQRSRALGVVAGTGKKECEMRHLSMEDDLMVGDLVVTSGEESLFPKGLPVGTIVSIERPPNALSPVVQVRPTVHLRAVEEVLVLGAPSE